jgi:hypothetical protein
MYGGDRPPGAGKGDEPRDLTPGRVRLDRPQAIEEPADWNGERAGERIEPARRDAILRAFIFLALLKGDAGRGSKLLDSDAEPLAAFPQPRADMDIDEVKGLAGAAGRHGC